MKKIILIAGSCLLLSLTGAQAQQTDSTKKDQSSQYIDQSNVQQQQTQTQAQQDSATQDQIELGQPTSASRQDSTKYRMNNMVAVESSAIPSSLRNTLSNDRRYNGWEQAAIYRDPRNDEYLVIMRGSNSESGKMYRFDKDGKLLKHQRGTGDH